MKTLQLRLTQRPFHLLAATLALALAAGVTQTANAQPHPGPGGPDMHMGMGMGQPHQMERMLDAVNATADQRAQVKSLVQAAQADLHALHQNGRQLHEQSQALFTQPTVDANAAEALRQQMLAQHDQASKRTLQLMLDVSRVLTPDQRKTLAERMAQRRSMMDRHRAERDALDKPPR